MGWEMPAGHLVYTTFVTSHPLNGAVMMTVSVIPYGLGADTTLNLALYINGVLRQSEAANVSSPIVSEMAGQPLTTTLGTLANFTGGVQDEGLTLFLTSSLPTGTTVTLGMMATSPIWMRTASEASASSFDAGVGQTFPTAPPESSSFTAVPDLAVWGETSAQ